MAPGPSASAPTVVALVRIGPGANRLDRYSAWSATRRVWTEQHGRMATTREDPSVRTDGGVKVPIVLAGAAAWSWRLLVVAAAGTMLVYVLITVYVLLVPVILALFLASFRASLVSRLRVLG